MEGALRRSLGSQAQHTHSLEDHTWSIQQSTTTHTKHIHNIQQQNSNYTHTHCELFHQTIHKHCQARNTQNTIPSDIVDSSTRTIIRPIITTINIRHDYRLQQNRRTFINYKKADWTQFTEDTESAFPQTTVPTNIHTANRIFTNIILIANKHNIPK